MAFFVKPQLSNFYANLTWFMFVIDKCAVDNFDFKFY